MPTARAVPANTTVRPGSHHGLLDGALHVASGGELLPEAGHDQERVVHAQREPDHRQHVERQGVELECLVQRSHQGHPDARHEQPAGERYQRGNRVTGRRAAAARPGSGTRSALPCPASRAMRRSAPARVARGRTPRPGAAPARRRARAPQREASPWRSPRWVFAPAASAAPGWAARAGGGPRRRRTGSGRRRRGCAPGGAPAFGPSRRIRSARPSGASSRMAIAIEPPNCCSLSLAARAAAVPGISSWVSWRLSRAFPTNRSATRKAPTQKIRIGTGRRMARRAMCLMQVSCASSGSLYSRAADGARRFAAKPGVWHQTLAAQRLMW